MVMETTAYFAEMFRKNLPLREVVDSNWTMPNSRLAIHYGLPTPKQTKLARVELSPKARRPLEPVEDDRPKTTIRSQLEAHATTANCVSCHAKIDPLSLAFENFDAIGRWRETERVEGGIGHDPPVDASGVLPDGKTFAGPSEFKKLLAKDDDRLAEAFLEQLATYALRRVMTVDDVQQLRSIAASAKTDDYRLQSLIRGLVMSELFQRR